jgi:uncharacterized DUF497 family protein
VIARREGIEIDNVERIVGQFTLDDCCPEPTKAKRLHHERFTIVGLMHPQKTFRKVFAHKARIIQLLSQRRRDRKRLDRPVIDRCFSMPCGSERQKRIEPGAEADFQDTRFVLFFENGIESGLDKDMPRFTQGAILGVISHAAGGIDERVRAIGGGE